MRYYTEILSQCEWRKCTTASSRTYIRSKYNAVESIPTIQQCTTNHRFLNPKHRGTRLTTRVFLLSTSTESVIVVVEGSDVEDYYLVQRYVYFYFFAISICLYISYHAHIMCTVQHKPCRGRKSNMTGESIWRENRTQIQSHSKKGSGQEYDILSHPIMDGIPLWDTAVTAV